MTKTKTLDANQISLDALLGLDELMPLTPVVAAPLAHQAVTLPDEAPTLGSLVLDADGALLEMTVAGLQPSRVPMSRAARVRALVSLRDTARRLLRSELANLPTPTLDALRESLNEQYDTFVASYGHLNHLVFRGQQPVYPNLESFHQDPGAPLVAALEDVVEVDGGVRHYAKAAIMSRSVVRPDVAPDVQTPSDALNVSLNQTGGVDVEFMAVLLGKAPHEVIAALDGAIYFNPLRMEWETADEFLSGRVVEKREAIEALDATRYAMQVTALRAVEPAPLSVADIRPSLGAPWIPVTVIAAFLDHLLNEQGSAVVTHNADAGLWRVRAARRQRGQRALRTWGAAGLDVFHLTQATLNQKDVRVTMPGENGPVTDPDGTAAARDKQSEIADAFVAWVFTDEARAAELVASYNAQFGGVVPRTFTGDYLTFPGMATTFTPYAHQRAAVARALARGNTGVFHPVGAGKTAVYAAVAMESRRLGLAKKPWLTVPSHMVQETAREVASIYPMARLLVPTPAESTRAGMAHFAARAATGDFDLVILSHDLFGRIPLTPATRLRLLDREQELALLALREEGDDEGGARWMRTQAHVERQFQKRRDALTAEAAQGGRTYFEDTGVDLLLVDEAHLMKNITLPGSLSQFTTEGSARADDFVQKSWFLNERTPGRGTVIGTGTPIANSLVEVFTWSHVLMPARMAALGFSTLPAWIATFAKKELVAEIGPLGQPRVKAQYVRFHNVPEMIAVFSEVAAIVLDGDLPLNRPTLATGAMQAVLVPQSPSLRRITEALLAEAEGRIPDARRVIEGEAALPRARRARGAGRGRNNARGTMVLRLMGEWNKGAIDPRLYSAQLPHPETSKLTIAADKIAEIHAETNAVRGTQLVFLDIGTPGGVGFCAYDALRVELVARGVPTEDIAFIHDAETPRARRRLMDAVRAGTVRVLIGSTSKAGSGLNVQTRVAAAHFIDIPWRPCDLDQRAGRVLRPGNQFFTAVSIYCYVTEGSSDTYRLQKVEHKARVIAQVMKGDPNVREVEDIDEVVLSLAQIKAIASGDPRLLERARLEADVVRAERMAREYAQQQWTARRDAERLPSRLAEVDGALIAVEQDVPRLTPTTGTQFVAIIDGVRVTERAIVNRVLRDAADRTRRRAYATGQSHDCFVGQMAGLDFGVRVGVMDGTSVIVRGTMIYETQRVALMNLETPDGANYCARAENLAASLPTLQGEWTALRERLVREQAEVARFLATPNPHLANVARLRAALTTMDRDLGFVDRAHAARVQAAYEDVEAA